MVKWKKSGEVIFLVAVVVIKVISAVPYKPFESDIVTLNDDESIRLPKSVIPIHYDLSLTTNVDTGDRSITGTVKIRVGIVTETNSITLHNRDLNINTIKLFAVNSENSIPTTHSTDRSRDFLIISTGDNQLEVNKEYLIEIEYNGNLRTDMGGFYQSFYYVTGKTEKRYLAATQFQSTSARTAFPNFDEPALKATFKLSITHASHYEAISNMNGYRTQISDKLTKTTFDETPIMSSYLLAFVVSDFAYRSMYNGPGKTEHRVYAREEDVENVWMALHNSDLFLRKLEEYCNYVYELPKMFSAAIPDFAAGAMENWGLILYKEQYLIANEHSHPREIFDVWGVTAHELAHQFFGNVVTYDWWDKIWLNEGFATFFEYYLVELVHPQERLRDQFNIRKTQKVFRRDSLHSTAPMTFDGDKPTEINYDKGGAVIRMFQYTIGDEKFRTTLNKYLIDNNHKPVATENLLKAFEDVLTASGKVQGLDFSRAFKTWELQKGYPMITVAYNSVSKEFEIKQEHYLSITEEKIESDESSWYIPLSYTTGANPNFENIIFSEYFEDKTAQKNIPTANIPNFDGSQWFIFNIQQIGYYRVNYDLNNWNKIIQVLNSDDYQKIHVLNRAQLVDDALTFAYDGVISYETAFGIVGYLERESDYIPWYSATFAFEKLNYMLKGSPVHSNFKRFVHKLLRKSYISNGLEHVQSDTVLQKFGRELSIEWTCKMGDKNCLSYARSQLSKDIPKALELTFLCNGFKNPNTKDEFNKVYEKLTKSTDQADRLRYIDALLCSSDVENLVGFLETTFGSEKDPFYRSHEHSRIYASIVSRSDVGMKALFDFMVGSYEKIQASFGNVFENWFYMAAKRISSEDDEKLIYATIKELESKNKVFSDQFKRSIASSIKFNRDFVESDKGKSIQAYIENYLKAIDVEEQKWRLPDSSEPLLYRIKLIVPEIHKGGLGFSGDVSIEVSITKNTDRIMFHSKNHNIHELKAFDRLENEIKIQDFSQQVTYDTLTIYFVKTLKAETKLTINIKYTADLETTGRGFYRTEYTEKGILKYLAATQFQPSSARQAFPCYDEPGYKTPFEISITHDKSYTAISNTNGIAFENGDGSVTTEFDRTPLMSSYLIAFVISDFKMISNEANRQPHEVLHRVWTKPNSIANAQYGLESSIKALKTLEEFCNFDYVLPKVDSAAIPSKSGAMENWGMVTYFEDGLIYEEDFTRIGHRHKFAGVTVIAHELAHQFFGNAATCKWWDQTWLNEGFATLFEHHLVDKMEPLWRIHHFMNVFALTKVFSFDADENTRSMTRNVNTDSDLVYAFDSITYDKSGSVLRMFMYTIGEELFRKCLNRYLKANNFKSVTSQNLVDAITETMNGQNDRRFDFERAFRTWETQKGFPLLNVRYDITSRSFILTQERFFKKKRINSEDKSSWHIPINFATSQNQNFTDTDITHYFVDGTEELKIPVDGLDGNFWYVFNKQQLSYYRVNYDDANWRSLIFALNSNRFASIHVMNRVQIIDDALSLGSGEYIDLSIAYDILKYLEREDDVFPWFAFESYFENIIEIYGNKNFKIKKFVHKLSKTFYDKYKLSSDATIPDDESLPDRYGRELATRFACSNGNEQCLEDAHVLVQHFVNQHKLIPKGLEGYYCYGLKGTGKQKLFKNVWDIMSNTDDSDLKQFLITALGCSDDPETLTAYLDSSIGDSGNVNYTSNEKYDVFKSVLSQDSAIPVITDFLKRADGEAILHYKTDLKSLLENVAEFIQTQEEQVIFHTYLSSHQSLSGDDFKSISNSTTAKLKLQKSTEYAQHVSQIERILDEWENGSSDEGQVWRLPKTSKPTHYKVHLDVRNIHSGDRAYTGTTEIKIEILEKTDKIVFHSKNQAIDEIKAMNLDANSEISVLRYRLSPAYETIVVYIDIELQPKTNILVNIKYSTSLVTSSIGFYQSSYLIDGKTRYLGTTQFEELGARYAFPCYDEPEFKARFELSFTHDKSLSAYSNSIGKSVENSDGTITTSFEPSPIMSSYLNAFVISDLKHIDNSKTKEDHETLHRIIVREDSLSKAQYALENSVASLKALEEYLDFKYELQKVDSAGVPNKRSAMENWGMVIYSESAMIYDEDYNNIPHGQKLRGVRVISHELAHQFFGNAVTAAWWKYIWLNEGFAQFLQYTITDMFQKDWRMNDFMNVLSLQSTAFLVDARTNSRAMTTEASTPEEISKLFDSIAYDKSGNVLRTFEHAIGSKLFRESLNHYLNTYNHQPVVSQNLVDSFVTILQRNNITNLDFDRAFRTWETQKGYPLINVRYNIQSKEFEITQERFFEQKGLVADDKSSWYIPLNYGTSKEPNFTDTIASDFFLNGETIKKISAEPGDWYIFNKQQRSYYRVNYEESNWNALSQALLGSDYNTIHVMNRAQLIDDSFSLVKAGYLNDYQTAYDILKYLVNEDDYFPWYVADKYIGRLYSVFGSKNAALNNFVKSLSVKFYNKYKLSDDNKIPSEPLPERYGRELAINLACEAGNEQCLDDAYKLVKLYVDEDQPIPNGLETIFCHGLRGTGKQDAFVKLWRKMQDRANSKIKGTLLNALGCTDDIVALKDYLETSIDAVPYSFEERRTIFTAVLNSHSSMQIVVDFLDKYELETVIYYQWTLETTLRKVANSITSKEDQSIFTNYLSSLKVPDPNDVLNSITKTLDNKALRSILSDISYRMKQQKTFNNERQMSIIKTIANEWRFGPILPNQFRLPKESKPEFYKIHLDVRNIQNGVKDYNGEVSITVGMLETTNRVVLHSKNQVIDEISAYDIATSRKLNITSHHLIPSTSLLVLFFENLLNSGSKISINIKYSTSLLNAHIGFYMVSSQVNGVTKYVAATQFESTGARYAFPCYDEPEYKAVFELSFYHHNSVNVFSNMMETIEPANDTNYVLTSFKPTPIMSSYLVAFVVSDYEAVNNLDIKKPEDLLQRVIVRPDLTNQLSFSLDTSIAAIKALEEYVGFKFELEKLDSIMVPGKSDAMENWGLITYYPSALVYNINPKENDHKSIFNGAHVIAHEVAHQFFGNAVTCKWWSHIWLNEGFATFMSYKMIEMMHSDWQMQNFMNIFSVHDALRIDSSVFERAMTTNVSNSQEIDSLFDSVAYDKSGSVIKMFEHAIGKENFQRAINLYVTRNNLKSVVSQDLMDAFVEILAKDKNNKIDFDRAFRTWEYSKGYPVIYVTFIADIQSFRITQERFFDDKANKGSDQTSWYIPLNYATAKNPNFDSTLATDYFVDGEKMWNILAPQHDSNSWYVFNKQQSGFYRVNYDKNNWKLLSNLLSSNDYNKIHVMNRAQLIDDALALTDAGYFENYQIFYDILKYLVNEDDFFPWYVVNKYINELYNVFGPKNAILNNFIRNISKKYYNKYKLQPAGVIPDENIVERYGREYAMKFACISGNQECLDDTFALVRNFVEKGEIIQNGLRDAMCYGIRGSGKQKLFTELWKYSQLLSDQSVNSQILDSLGCTDDETALFDYLESALSYSHVNYSLADRQNVFIASLNSKVIVPVFVKFMTKNSVLSILTFQLTNKQMTTSVARTVRTIEEQAMILSYLSTSDRFSAEDYKQISVIMSNAISRQKEPKYNDAIQLMAKLFPLDPNNTEPTVETTSPTTTPTTTPEPPDSTPPITQPETEQTTLPNIDIDTTQKTETSSPGSAVSIGIKFSTLIFCLAIGFFWKF